MDKIDIKGILEDISEEIDSTSDLRGIVKKLFNVIELLVSENNELRAENQRLRDEISRLKGEQGKANIRKQTQDDQKDNDISSEKNRKQKNKNKRKKLKKKGNVAINQTEICKFDKAQLPPDAQFKGYKSVVVQDIIIQTDNIEFKKEIYYSPSLNKTFMAPLPEGYQGEFGPFIKALTIELHQNMSEPAIANFLNTHGAMISPATISRILTDKHEIFQQEKQDIVEAGLNSSIYQQMDDTGARVNGKNHYTHILCNAFYTAYFTREHKNRLTILEILTQGDLKFHFNASSFSLMEQMGLSNKTLNLLQQHGSQEIMIREEADIFLMKLFPNPEKHKTARQLILDAGAITAYQQLPNAVKILLTDDAPQYNLITEYAALCWIHDGRHYKKLSPAVNFHIKEKEIYLDMYWEYYHQLLAYRQAPTQKLSEGLEKIFNSLFSIKADYDQLSARIEKTNAKKNSLLLALKYPEVPLHNNASELGARKQARYRDISFQTQNEKGTIAKDMYMTIEQTAKKLLVNTFKYIYDRITGKYEMSSLADLIREKSSAAAFNTS